MAEETITFTDSMGFKVGDLFALPPLRRVRWWQFWKRWPFARRPATYRVVSMTSNVLTVE